MGSPSAVRDPGSRTAGLRIYNSLIRILRSPCREALVLVALGVLTFRNAVSGPFIYDDATMVVTNATIRSVATALSPPAHSTPASGRPLVNLSLAFNYAMGGLEPAGYHALNIALHLTCALLLFAVVRRTLSAAMPNRPSAWGPDTLALACAAIWMLHPLDSEPADYISARTESTMALCYLLTLYASIRSAAGRHRAAWTIAAIVSCAAGMACKESMATAPLMIVLYDRVFRFSSWRDAWRARWPIYAGLAATWLILAGLMSSGPRANSVGFAADPGLVPVVSVWVYVLNQAVMIVRYLRLAIWPDSLVLDYGVARQLTLAAAWPYAIAVVLLLAAVVVLLYRQPRLGYLGAWLFVTLAPASSIVPVHTEVGAERRMYVPMMALTAGAVLALWRLCAGAGAGGSPGRTGRPARRGAGFAFAAVLILAGGALASATVQRNAEYASGVSIWQTVLDRWPHGRARLNLAIELKRAGRPDEAMAALRAAVDDYPDARSILGFELLDRGLRDEGIAELRQFIRDRPSHINIVAAHGRIADALFAQQRFAEAAAEYREFLAHQPDHVSSWTNFGIAMAAGGNIDEAVRAFERSVALAPQDANTHRNLANALLDRRDFARAAAEASEAIRLAPKDTIAREILSLAQQVRSTKSEVRKPEVTKPQDVLRTSNFVLELVHRPVALRAGIGVAHDPAASASPQAQAFYDQGLAYLHSFVWIEAARSFNQALTLDPGLALAHVGLTIAYTELNAQAAAREALTRAKAVARTEHDRRHVAARALQMAAEEAPADGAKLAAYRVALDQALVMFSADEEFWLQRGQAESPDPAERGQGSVAGSIRYYEKALALAPGHFTAHHYLTHAYENTARVQAALTHGAAYAKMAPAVPHARHMDGHNLRRAGRIDEAIAEFEAADGLETAYFAAERVPVEYDWHYQHNLDLLATSYQYIGQMRKAEALFTRSFAIASSLVVQEFNKREWPEFLLARGRANEALAAAGVMAAHRSPVISAAGHLEAGRARLALGQFKEAADEGNVALRLIRGAEGGAMVATPLQAFQGEFLLRTGKKEQGRPMLEEVVRKARALPGPDAWTQTLFTIEAIGRAAREVGDWEFAAWAARQMLEHDPNYAGTHAALALVAEHSGDVATVRAERALVEKYWKNADPELRKR